MSLDIDRSLPDQTKIRFILDDGHPEGSVSVVGTFNNWTAGLDELVSDGRGFRSVTIGLPYDSKIVFRYLGPGDTWYDEPDADEITADGSVLYPIPPPPPPPPPPRD
jgi:hypothetical protein